MMQRVRRGIVALADKGGQGVSCCDDLGKGFGHLQGLFALLVGLTGLKLFRCLAAGGGCMRGMEDVDGGSMSTREVVEGATEMLCSLKTVDAAWSASSDNTL